MGCGVEKGRAEVVERGIGGFQAAVMVVGVVRRSRLQNPAAGRVEQMQWAGERPGP